ncbi:MAG: hypothetical protein KDA61_22655, partial [Planctomycetales bacterium]|nr:hypothetical protein [Planctomycetales bacterium]
AVQYRKALPSDNRGLPDRAVRCVDAGTLAAVTPTALWDPNAPMRCERRYSGLRQRRRAGAKKASPGCEGDRETHEVCEGAQSRAGRSGGKGAVG